MAKTDKNGPEHPYKPELGPCWVCGLKKKHTGHAQVKAKDGDGRFVTLSAHRVSYEHFVEVIPEGLSVLHSCDRPACVNPAHLRVGTNQDNIKDKVERHRSGSRGRRITPILAASMQRLRAGGASYQKITDITGLCYSTVSAFFRRMAEIAPEIEPLLVWFEAHPDRTWQPCT
ncbi:HNH endonuclease signature motif containing protein, partial [Acetobacter nitrogenifigens]